MTKTAPKPTPARAASSLPKVHLVAVSGNAKTGPIPVSTTEKASCPGTCPFLSQCYADFGPLALHWNKIPERGMEWADFARKIAALPRGQLWRHNQAGDLPASPAGRLRAEALRALVRANKGRRGFTYTHHALTPQNVALLREAIPAWRAAHARLDSEIGPTTAEALRQGLAEIRPLPADGAA